MSYISVRERAIERCLRRAISAEYHMRYAEESGLVPLFSYWSSQYEKNMRIAEGYEDQIVRHIKEEVI